MPFQPGYLLEINILKTTPRDVHKLNLMIAQKEKEFRNCHDFPKRDILEAEWDALKHVRQVILAKQS